MPVVEIERLTPNSSEEQIQAALSSCIVEEMNGGYEQEQAIAMCNSMIQKKIRGESYEQR